MQKLDLNLAANPFRNNLLLWVSYSAASVALLVFTVWSIHAYFDYRARVDGLRDVAGNFESRRLDFETRGRRALAAIQAFDIDSLEVQASMANKVIDRKAFSWTRLFNSVEQIQPYGVRMTSVRPVFTGDKTAGAPVSDTVASVPVALEGIAKSWTEFTNLERALQDDPHFGRVLPGRLTRTDGNEILFLLRFDYFADGNAGEGVDPVEQEPGDVALTTASPDGEPQAGEQSDDPGPAVDEPVITASPAAPGKEPSTDTGADEPPTQPDGAPAAPEEKTGGTS